MTPKLNMLVPSCQSRIKSGMADPASSVQLDSGFRRNEDFDLFSCRGNRA
jgi:hypothetical protein